MRHLPETRSSKPSGWRNTKKSVFFPEPAAPLQNGTQGGRRPSRPFPPPSWSFWPAWESLSSSGMADRTSSGKSTPGTLSLFWLASFFCTIRSGGRDHEPGYNRGWPPLTGYTIWSKNIRHRGPCRPSSDKTGPHSPVRERGFQISGKEKFSKESTDRETGQDRGPRGHERRRQNLARQSDSSFLRCDRGASAWTESTCAIPD